MPKDATKQSHRGIGFVTFAGADPVEAVMSAPHTMAGQELAIDRATPKEKVRHRCLHPHSTARFCALQGAVPRVPARRRMRCPLVLVPRHALPEIGAGVEN